LLWHSPAIAQGIVAQLRILGGSLGVAAGFIVLNNRITETLTGLLTAEEMDAFYRSPAITKSFDVPKQLGVRTAYIDAFNISMYICAGISAACLVSSLFTYQKNPPTIQKRLQELETLYAHAATGNEQPIP
jgi:hypothetical protein